MSKKKKEVMSDLENPGKDPVENLEEELKESEDDNIDLQKEMFDKDKGVDMQALADELGKEHAKSKKLNLFGKKKKDDDVSSKKIEQLDEKLKEKDEKIKEMENHLKVLVAENRNQKNRIENEFRSKIKFAMEDFFRDFITIKDDFDKAMEFLPDSENSEKDPFVEGIKNLHRKMENVMLNHGLEGYSSVGEQFDPAIHQAMSIVDMEEKKENEVVAEYMKGYKYYERVLRAAMVVVASGKNPEVKEEVIPEENDIEESADPEDQVDPDDNNEKNEE